METIETKICTHCGADDQLHQYETNRCPRHGREETREGHKQCWESSTFLDSGIKTLHDAAPDLLEAIKEMHDLYSKDNKTFGEHRPTDAEKEKVLIKAYQAILKAGGTKVGSAIWIGSRHKG